MQASESLVNCLRDAVGPDGRAVMAQSTTCLVITRSGGQILNLAFSQPPDPVASLLLKSAIEFHDKFGDGVKSFVIFLNALLQQVAFLSKSQCLVKKLEKFVVHFEDCFKHKNCTCVLTDNNLQSVIETFFSTRFAPVVSEILSKLVFEWVSKLSSVLETSIYVSNFSLLCIKSSPFPVSLSSVQSGFLLKGIYTRKLPFKNKHCVLKVYHHPLDIIPDPDDIEVEVLEVLKEENDENLILFVTNVVLQERAQFLLNFKHIYFIHGVATDSTKFLFDQMLTSKDYVVEYCHVNDYMWISLPKVSQILLKAPNAAISSEYAEGILDCLKMLQSSFKDSSCTIPVGKCFKVSFVKKLFSSTSSPAPKVPPVRNRDELLVWNKTSATDSDLLKHIDGSRLNNFDMDIVEPICRALMSTVVFQDSIEKGLEPLNLWLEVISKGLNAFVSLYKVDRAVLKPKKGRLV